MLHFLENHDEQRIASPEFAGNFEKVKPAMVVSATISTSPTMIYFAQELGEDGSENSGFGTSSRTSIFDYIGVPTLQRWVNDKKFDGGKSTTEELALRDFYKRLLNFTIKSDALMGEYQDLHQFNRENTENYNAKLLSYTRFSNNEKLIIIANFDAEKAFEFELKIPLEIIKKWNINEGTFLLKDTLYNKKSFDLKVTSTGATAKILVNPLESFILKLQ